MDVVILAGGPCPEDLREATGCAYRCDLPIRDRTLLEIVVEAAQAVGDPVVVGPHAPDGVRRVEGGSRFFDSFKRGVEATQGDRALIVTADLPDVSPTSLERFLGACDSTTSIQYPIVPIEAVRQRYPGQKRTVVRLREGDVTGGNVALFDAAAIRAALPRLDEAYAARKKPWKLAASLGTGLLVRLVLSKVVPSMLPVNAIEAAAERLLGVSARAVILDVPEIGADVDDLEQYRSFTGLK